MTDTRLARRFDEQSTGADILAYLAGAGVTYRVLEECPRCRECGQEIPEGSIRVRLTHRERDGFGPRPLRLAVGIGATVISALNAALDELERQTAR